MKPKTVKYFSAKSFNSRFEFIKVLFKWQGSVWKLLWVDFLWFISLYIGVTLLYRLYLIKDPENKRVFDAIVVYMNKAAEMIPLSFLLGFFVSDILEQWWTIINCTPWMTQPALTCQALIIGDQKETLNTIKLTVTRYMNLAWILSIINISKKVKKRFSVHSPGSKEMLVIPKQNQLKKSSYIPIRLKMNKINSDIMIQKSFGRLILEEEITALENLERNPNKPSHLIPLMWATKLLERSLKAGYLKSESEYTDLVNMIQDFENNLGNLSRYNDFNIPLAYTQVIVIVVYIFLITEIFSQQIITSTNNSIMEVYFPIYGIFKFLIYMGWFKIGLCFIDPFGDDPTDLPLDEILDYNLEVSSSICSSGDQIFPDFLSESFNESNGDRFEVLNGLCALTNKNKIKCIEVDKSCDVITLSTYDGSCD